jgi:hypothetical protein
MHTVCRQVKHFSVLKEIHAYILLPISVCHTTLWRRLHETLTGLDSLTYMSDHL